MRPLAPQRVVTYMAVMVAVLLIVTAVLWSRQMNQSITLFALLLGCGLVLMGTILGMNTATYAWRRRESAKLAVSKAKQTEQREALLTIINATNQGIFTISPGGIVRIYNAALLSLLDTNKSLSGTRVDDMLPLYDQAGESVSLFSLMKEQARFERDDLSLRFADGDAIRLHLSVSKIQGSFSSHHRRDREGYVCIVRDVTKEKSLEEERDEFISVVSHELRTPVTIAEGTISNVQYFLENGADATKLIPSLREAHDQVLLLANMINDLGTLSRAERGVGDELEVIDIKALVEELYKKYSPDAKKKKLSLDLDMGSRLGTITTSRLYLEELLQNLITNAIKYTQTGSVTLGARRTAAGVEFLVTDSGIGISKTDLKHIFEKFYRSEDYRTRETSGTGLGLYVAAKLMKKLGTSVHVRSRLNHGSTFSFTLSDTPQN